MLHYVSAYSVSSKVCKCVYDQVDYLANWKFATESQLRDVLHMGSI